jgi:hypothetical protein
MFQAIHRSHVHIQGLRWQPLGHLYSTCTTVYIYDGLTRLNPSHCQVFLPNARSQCPANQPIPHPPIHTAVYKRRLQRLGVLSAYLRSRNRIAVLCTPYFPPTRAKTTKKKKKKTPTQCYHRAMLKDAQSSPVAAVLLHWTSRL